MSQTDTPSPWRVARAVAMDIKIAHSVFALPFALLGAVLALEPDPATGALAGKLSLVVLCMVFARTWAMLVNRLADRRFDEANPRTSRRAIPSGRLSVPHAIAAAVFSALAFIAGAGAFGPAFDNWWPLILSVPVLLWIALYSYTKRFTALCHLFLGGALAASPVCAAIAIDPTALTTTPAVWWIAGMVLCWVAGFDVIYALQDLDFDREAGLSSIPAALGRRGAAVASRMLHTVAAGSLVLAWQAEPRFEWLFGAAVVGAACLLIAEHVVLERRGLAGLDMAFFTLNGIVSCLLGAFGIADLLL